MYGAVETNPQSQADKDFNPTMTVDWTHKGLYITRLRLLSDPGFPMWDVSYCHGVLKDGTQVRVQLPFDQLPKRKMRATLVAHARASGKFIKGLLDNISTLN